MKCPIAPGHGEMYVWGDKQDDYYCPLKHFVDSASGHYLAEGIIYTEVLIDNAWTPKIKRVNWYTTTTQEQKAACMALSLGPSPTPASSLTLTPTPPAASTATKQYGSIQTPGAGKVVMKRHRKTRT